MTDAAPAPPPPSTNGPNYVLLGILGAIAALLVVIVVILLSGGDDSPSATTVAESTTIASSSTEAGSTSTSAAAPSTTAAPATTAAATTLPPFQGDTVSRQAEGDFLGTFNFLHDVRYQQRQGGFTRVVFDFETGEVPWWSVGYVPGPFTDMSDTPIAIGGSAYLEVLLASTGYDLSGDDVRITYEGPDRIEANTNSVVEIVRIDDFEGVSTWIIAVDGEKPFTVGTLTGPPRLYIDIAD